jgi:hypothetical protein
VEDCTWTFGRGDEQFQIRRTHDDEGVRLVITGAGAPRSFFFPDLSALEPVQADMEAFLLKTGWRFVEFSPDRRTGRDRRTWPRVTERRRWWTDGIIDRWISSIKGPNRRRD